MVNQVLSSWVPIENKPKLEIRFCKARIWSFKVPYVIFLLSYFIKFFKSLFADLSYGDPNLFNLFITPMYEGEKNK